MKDTVLKYLLLVGHKLSRRLRVIERKVFDHVKNKYGIDYCNQNIDTIIDILGGDITFSRDGDMRIVLEEIDDTIKKSIR